VPDELIADTLLELRQKFGAVFCESLTIQGIWQHEEQVYRDDSMRVFVDVPDLRYHASLLRNDRPTDGNSKTTDGYKTLLCFSHPLSGVSFAAVSVILSGRPW
jgi:hypothetical protein